MLNISENSVSKYINDKDFKSLKLIKKGRVRRWILWIFSALVAIVFLCLFLPWTQNIRAKGDVTTRYPQQRPQAIQSVIAGRIEGWHVKEGDYVDKGDTIAFISEIKSEYFDPQILERTSDQIEAKEQSINSSEQKIDFLQDQYNTIKDALNLKRNQIKNKIIQKENKIKMDSIDLNVTGKNLEIAKNQLQRTQELYDKGLKSLTELQEKQNKVQNLAAKYSVQENKLLNTKNDLINLNLELSTVEREYSEKLLKNQSDQQSAISDMLSTKEQLAKLKNRYSNYVERRKHYAIKAPQDGYITKTVRKGIGETLKEGADIATIMPAEYDLAVEVYFRPRDIPLIHKGNKVQLRFDGWPAVVISGWPESSTGVFFGEIVAIDRFISNNGKYRVLITPEGNKEWPEELSIGTGTTSFVLLKEVPIWYEVWRQLNGFPADYYQKSNKRFQEVKRKAPINSVK